MLIKISKKWLTKKFPCSYNYIINNCKGRCCGIVGKIMISLLPKEEIWHKKNGFNTLNGFLLPDKIINQCPYKLLSGLCKLHNTEFKPFGCIASPFTLNNKNTLIIRYRYSRLKCFDTGDYAYNIFKKSLILLFGLQETINIINQVKNNNGDIFANMDMHILNKIKYLDNLKRIYNKRI